MEYPMPLQLKAYEAMKTMILSGELTPGAIYSETRTAQQLGVSRTPMRDAIRRLAQEGYLDVFPSRGFRIHEVTLQDLEETYQIRCALEGFCVVQLARDKGTARAEQTLAALDGLLREQQNVICTSHDIQQFAPFDQAFHEQIVYSLGNRTISETFDSLHYQMRRQTVLSLDREGRMEQTLREHQAIVDGIRQGDVNSSYNAALAHLEQAKTLIGMDMS